VARAATQLAKAEIKLQSSAKVFAHANELFNKRNYVEELL
jgi:flagellin-like hook-associated protein FlgL